MFGSRSGLFEDFLGSDFFRIGDDSPSMAADTNQDTIKAAFKNGVLTITMDKREASAPRQGRSIPING